MAAPAHYIRTIHTSFTAAHPHSSSAWATSTSRAHAHSNILINLTATYNNSLPASKYPPGLGTQTTTGRKRSASIRVAPPAYAQRMQPQQRMKFDPFAEEPEHSAQLSTSAVLYNTPLQPSPRNRSASIPYTIQIPPAAPADIQKHQQQQQQYRQQLQQQNQQQQQQRSSPPPPPTLTPAQPVQRVPTPPVIVVATSTTAPPPPNANAVKEREARSKIVAGILLNRVHAVGKPMRRRAAATTAQPRTYVPSGLSTCISIEA